MAQLLSVVCSALSTIKFLNDGKWIHEVGAAAPSMPAYPLRLGFTLVGRLSECGWTNQRQVYLWIVKAQSLCRAIIQKADKFTTALKCHRTHTCRPAGRLPENTDVSIAVSSITLRPEQLAAIRLGEGRYPSGRHSGSLRNEKDP